MYIQKTVIITLRQKMVALELVQVLEALDEAAFIDTEG